ncbi:MAG: hypothetical protein FWC61_01105 [Proteobacteria bacterium]|nr:hypothetical protein [Pseudomonadota bacterium]
MAGNPKIFLKSGSLENNGLAERIIKEYFNPNKDTGYYQPSLFSDEEVMQNPIRNEKFVPLFDVFSPQTVERYRLRMVLPWRFYFYANFNQMTGNIFNRLHKELTRAVCDDNGFRFCYYGDLDTIFNGALPVENSGKEDCVKNDEWLSNNAAVPPEHKRLAEYEYIDYFDGGQTKRVARMQLSVLGCWHVITEWLDDVSIARQRKQDMMQENEMGTLSKGIVEKELGLMFAEMFFFFYPEEPDVVRRAAYDNLRISLYDQFTNAATGKLRNAIRSYMPPGKSGKDVAMNAAFILDNIIYKGLFGEDYKTNFFKNARKTSNIAQYLRPEWMFILIKYVSLAAAAGEDYVRKKTELKNGYDKFNGRIKAPNLGRAHPPKRYSEMPRPATLIGFQEHLRNVFAEVREDLESLSYQYGDLINFDPDNLYCDQMVKVIRDGDSNGVMGLKQVQGSFRGFYQNMNLNKTLAEQEAGRIKGKAIAAELRKLKRKEARNLEMVRREIFARRQAKVI